jgi:hypothetical protein
MRRILILLTLAAGALAAQTRTSDPAKLAAIEDMLSVLKMEQQQEQAIGQIRSAFMQQIENEVRSHGGSDSPQFKEEFGKFQDQLFQLIFMRMSWSRMKPEYVRLYDETFTLEELKGITAFYRSPAGKAFVDKLPQVTQRAIEIGQRVVAEAQPDIEKLTEDFMQRLKKKP